MKAGGNLRRKSKSAVPRRRDAGKPDTKNSRSSVRVLTVGHSTRSLEDFLSLLRAHGVQCVVDIRTVPRSRHNPQFDKMTLPDALRQAGIGYMHMAGLGGLRKPRRDSPNGGWKNASFRGYADYMQTPEFVASLQKLLPLAQNQCIALLCAEAVPWRCHRSLVADALTVRNIPVEHILSATRRQEHRVTPWAKVHGSQISYPPDSLSFKFDSGQHKRPRP